jgi:hypothetical protein
MALQAYTPTKQLSITQELVLSSYYLMNIEASSVRSHLCKVLTDCITCTVELKDLKAASKIPSGLAEHSTISFL